MESSYALNTLWSWFISLYFVDVACLLHGLKFFLASFPFLRKECGLMSAPWYVWRGCLILTKIYIDTVSLEAIQTTAELGYNDFGLCDTLAIALYILWYQPIPHKAHVFLPCLVQHT